MEEIEVPVEKVQEEIHEQAHHSQEKWVSLVALSSAVLAVFAAIAALMAGHHSNEAMIDQIQASDSWSYYQAKGIKSSILASRLELLESLGKKMAEKDRGKLESYKKDQEEIAEKAHEKESSSAEHLVKHQILAKSVTFFQVAIAVAAISVLTRRRRFWFVGIAFGLMGVFFFLQGLMARAG